MSNYLANSTNIFVFPTTKREGLSRSSRLLTEKNLVDIVNKLVDTNSFVISRSYRHSYNQSFEFNINGYLIRVDNFDEIVDYFLNEANDDFSIWANIIIKTTGDYEELYGADENGSYNGVIFSINSPLNAGGQIKSLRLLNVDYQNLTYEIPDDSLVKFTFDRIKSPLDCGEI